MLLGMDSISGAQLQLLLKGTTIDQFEAEARRIEEVPLPLPKSLSLLPSLLYSSSQPFSPSHSTPTILYCGYYRDHPGYMAPIVEVSSRSHHS